MFNRNSTYYVHDDQSGKRVELKGSKTLQLLRGKRISQRDISKCISDIIFSVYFCNVPKREARLGCEEDAVKGGDLCGDGWTVRVSWTYKLVSIDVVPHVSVFGCTTLVLKVPRNSLPRENP